MSTLSITALALVVVSAATLRSLFSPRHSGGIYELRNNSFFSAWPFFAKRYDFLWSNFKKTGAKMFRFRLLRHSVVAISGDLSRKVFFNEAGLDFLEGYRILRGGVPQLSDIDVQDPERGNLSFFAKQLLSLLKRERIEDG
ncbi:hypothetical protein H0H92_006202 [Tricholoma furcatifolium]|nr:hypothetical protein H0H92_006202 [Tricholoma furcatifolium]